MVADAAAPEGPPREPPGRGAWRREGRTVVLHEGRVAREVPAPFSIVSESAFVPVPLEFEPHTHDTPELVWVRGGTMTVRLPDSLVTVPDGRGLWIPRGTVHSGRCTARALLSAAVFAPGRSPLDHAPATVVEVTPVLASLLTHLERTDLAPQARMRAEAVVFDVLEPAQPQLAVRLPRAAELDPIVSALLADPTDGRTLGEWAEQVRVSERTVARRFRALTGLSFVQWRQVLRIHHALTLLSEGRAVQEVSELMGYTRPSTFIASFRRVMGTTPGVFGGGTTGRPGGEDLSGTPYRLS